MHQGIAHDHGDLVSRRLQIGIVLNLLFALAELVAGLTAGSLALIGDAWHNFSDVIGLAISWIALRQVDRPANERKTFGYHRASILAALANGIALIGVTLWLFYAAINRLGSPVVPEAPVMMAAAGIGFLINIGVALSLRRGTRDLNIRSAFLHLLSDGFVSLGVVVAGAVILFSGWSLIDPLLSCVIGLLVLVGCWDIVAETVNVLMEGVPRGVRMDRLLRAVRSFPEVKDVHDLHVWSLSSHVYAMSCHLQVADLQASHGNRLLDRINHMLKERFGIAHTTFQLEAEACTLEQACALHYSDDRGRQSAVGGQPR
jgi:cobalt-zinc-cadmium efflux system protein